MNVEKRLVEKMGSTGEWIMYDEGREYAAEAMTQYKKLFGNSSSNESILLNTSDGLRATGWGIFEFHRNEEGFFVTVRHPPRIEGRGAAQ